MKVKSHKVSEIVLILINMVCFLFTLVAVRDMHVSQGVGLFFCVMVGAGDKAIFDIGVDIVCALALLTLIILPCAGFRKIKPEAVFRFFSVFLAVMPVLSLAYLVHLPDGPQTFAIRESISNGNVLKSIAETGGALYSVIVILIPMMILFMGLKTIYKKQNEKENAFIFGIREWSALGLCIFLVIGSWVFPGLENLLCFGLAYILLIKTFAIWESVVDRNDHVRNFSFILYGGCMMRGIFLLIRMMSMNHI